MKSDIPWKLKTQEGINQTLYKDQTRPENPKGDFNLMSWWLSKKNFKNKTQLFVTRLHHYSMVDTTFGLLSPQFVCLKLSKRKFCLLHPFQITNQLFHPALIYKLFPTFLLQLSFFGEKKNNSFSNFLLHQRNKRHVVELLVVIIIEPKSI